MANHLNFLFFIGRPFSPLYAAVMKARAHCYRRGILRRHKFPVPVVSVGNLVLGGTGKTPTVQHIATLLIDNEIKPAVVSRGYGGKSKDETNVVSNGKEILLSPQYAGDEPYLLAENLPGVPVLTGRKRKHPCEFAIKEFNVDCIILDDGFQHLSVERDIDLVLFDSTHLAGNSRIFPGGPLREPVSALNRCTYFLLTGENKTNRERAEKFGDLLKKKFSSKSLYLASSNSYSYVSYDEKKTTEKLTGKVYAFCGIANPDRFKTALDELNIETTGFETYPDHTRYSQKTVDQIIANASAADADILLTTQKDIVKLKSVAIKFPCYYLQQKHKFTEAFDKQILADLRTLRQNSY